MSEGGYHTDVERVGIETQRECLPVCRWFFEVALEENAQLVLFDSLMEEEGRRLA
jgi:hypothetical protein